MTFFGPDLRNGLPIGLGSVAGFGIAPQFSPASLFLGGTVQGAWYDPSDPTTLFSDRAGTTPCGTPGQGSVVPVGLMLDKSQGLVLSANVLSASWTVSAGATASGSSVTLNSASDVFAYQDVMTSGLRYFVTFDYNITSGQTGLYVGSNGGSGDTILSLSGLSGTGTYSGYFRASNTTFIFRDNSGCVASFTNITLRVQQGNHAIAANDTTARPELRARVNFLTYSEQFDNAAWDAVASGAVVTPNTNVAPDGTLTADTIAFTSGGYRYQQTTSPSISAGQSVTYSAWVWSASKAKIVLRVYDAGATDIGMQSVSLTTTPQRISITLVATATRTQWFVGFDNRVIVGGDGIAGDVIVWGAQLTATNEFPANTYQRISDANTYDAVGFPRYLVANGTSSAMSTPGNVNLSGTDKVTVFAGVRKLSDAPDGTIGELGTSFTSFGGWYLVNVASPAGYQYAGRGNRTAVANDATNASIAGPNTSVLTAQQDLNNNTPSTIRRNGALAGSSISTTFGGGNFGSYPLFIGARNNSSIFFNGNIYGLTVVGSALSAGQITQMEQWLAGKTGITI